MSSVNSTNNNMTTRGSGDISARINNQSVNLDPYSHRKQNLDSSILLDHNNILNSQRDHVPRSSFIQFENKNQSGPNSKRDQNNSSVF